MACVLCIAQFLLLRADARALRWPEPVLWLSLLNATLCTFAPVLMVMMAIERIGAALAAQAGMIGPMSTILMGVWILGEPFTAWIVAGTVLVLAGIWLLTVALNSEETDTWIGIDGQVGAGVRREQGPGQGLRRGAGARGRQRRHHRARRRGACRPRRPSCAR